MKFFALVLCVVVALGAASAGYIGHGWSSGWAPSRVVYSRPVVRRVVYSPSYSSGWSSGWSGGHGGWSGGHGGWSSGGGWW